MIGSFFNKLRNKSTEADAAEKKVWRIADYFRANPSAWDRKLMGDEQATEQRILDRLLVSIDNAGNVRKLRLVKISTWAAAAVLLIGITAGIFKDALLDKLITYPQMVVQTRAGRQQKIVLPDSSVVFLNAGTRLSYPEHFSHKLREVTLLEGEAYFDIKHDTKRPFVVKADQIKTTVLGTTFNIRAYRFIGDVTVTVSSGKVGVNSQSAKGTGQPYFILPDEQLTYTKTSGQMQKSTAKAKDALGWMDGKLLFTNEKFSQVAGLLQNKYNVKIEFDDNAFAEYHFSASFEASESLADVLDALTLTKGLQYTIKDKKIRIYRNAP